MPLLEKTCTVKMGRISTSSSYCHINHLSVGLLNDLAVAVAEQFASCLSDIELELTFLEEPG